MNDPTNVCLYCRVEVRGKKNRWDCLCDEEERIINRIN